MFVLYQLGRAVQFSQWSACLFVGERPTDGTSLCYTNFKKITGFNHQFQARLAGSILSQCELAHEGIGTTISLATISVH